MKTAHRDFNRSGARRHGRAMHEKSSPVVGRSDRTRLDPRRLASLIRVAGATACGGLNSQGLAGTDGGATGGAPGARDRPSSPEGTNDPDLLLDRYRLPGAGGDGNRMRRRFGGRPRRWLRRTRRRLGPWRHHQHRGRDRRGGTCAGGVTGTGGGARRARRAPPARMAPRARRAGQERPAPPATKGPPARPAPPAPRARRGARAGPARPAPLAQKAPRARAGQRGPVVRQADRRGWRQGTAGAGGGAFICQADEACTAHQECQTACSGGADSHSTFCGCADQGGGGLTLACVPLPCGGRDAAVNDAGPIFGACDRASRTATTAISAPTPSASRSAPRTHRCTASAPPTAAAVAASGPAPPGLPATSLA